MILNAGARTDPYGDVRIDIVRNETLTVVCDIHSLPFRDKVFSETRCFHVLEHLPNLRLGVSELRRVTNGRIIARVPIFHLYSYLLETINFLRCFVLCPISILNGHGLSFVKNSLIGISNWKKRYSDHLWYIRFDTSKINKQFMIPKEYEFVI